MDPIQQASDRILSFLDQCTDEALGWSRTELALKLGIDASDVRIALATLEREDKVTCVIYGHTLYYASNRARVESALKELVGQGKVETYEGPDGQPCYRAKAGALRRLWHRIRGRRR